MYAHKILVENPNGRRLIGRPKYGVEDLSWKQRGWSVDCNQLIQGRQAYLPVWTR